MSSFSQSSVRMLKGYQTIQEEDRWHVKPDVLPPWWKLFAVQEGSFNVDFAHEHRELDYDMQEDQQSSSPRCWRIDSGIVWAFYVLKAFWTESALAEKLLHLVWPRSLLLGVVVFLWACF